MVSKVVFVHGVPTTARLWDGVIAHLDGTRETVALDLPGFAQPPPDGWTATKEEYAEWLLHEVAAAATDGPVHLVGHDWGCLLVCRVASLRPELLRSVAFGNGPIDPHWPLHSLWVTWNVRGEGERWMEEFDLEAFAERMQAAGVPQAVTDTISWRNPWNRSVTLSLYRSAVGVGREWAEDLARIVIPSMALWGTKDLRVPIEIGRRMASRMGAEVVGLPGSHFWPAEVPDLAARELERHWARADSWPVTLLTQSEP